MTRKLSSDQVAFAQVLEGQEWSHARIAEMFAVSRSAISYALSRRKTSMPSAVDRVAAEVTEKVLQRVRRVTVRAVARELTRLAAEMTKGGG